MDRVQRHFRGTNAFADIAKRNMAMFEEAGKAFAAAAPVAKPAAEKAAESEVDKLRADLAALQAKVDKLGNSSLAARARSCGDYRNSNPLQVLFFAPEHNMLCLPSTQRKEVIRCLMVQQRGRFSSFGRCAPNLASRSSGLERSGR